MQILFGVHETIVKINSKSMNIEYIQHYISTHFNSRTIVKNSINIPASKANLYHRTFLLKWLYSLYSKKNKPMPELKESLLQRYHKAIKITLPQKIIHSIRYKVVNNETLHLAITPQNAQIALKIKTFLQVKMTIFPIYLEIKLETFSEKARLQKLLNSREIINVPHKHIYNKQEIDEFFHEPEEEKQEIKIFSPLSSAYVVLKMNPTDDIKRVKKQYKYLAKELHPDKVSSEDKELVALHTKKFQELLECYEIILSASPQITTYS